MNTLEQISLLSIWAVATTIQLAEAQRLVRECVVQSERMLGLFLHLLWLKKAQAIWRDHLTAEDLKFPHRRSHVIKSLVETAKPLEDTSPETCIAIEGRVIAMMSEEVAQSRRTAYAALRAMSAMSEGDDGV